MRPLAAARGFTLIELMITVVVVGILAAVAYPAYMEYVAKGHRTQLKTQLTAAHQWMERAYSERYFYGDSASATVNTAFGSQGFVHSPSEGPARYDLAVAVGNSGQTYTITATRTSTGTMANDRCGNPTVTNTGLKGVEAGTFGSKYADAAAAVADCWR